MDEQQQELAAFESSIRGEAVAVPAADPAPAAGPEAELPLEQPEAVEPVAEQPEQPEAQAQAPAAPSDGNQPEQQPQTEDDPEVFEGFKRSEMKRLMESASKVETLEQQLRRANGKIGELNSRLQSAPLAAPAAAQPQAQQPAQLPEHLKQFEQDYPDVFRNVQALIQMQQPQPQAAPPAAPQEPVAAGIAGAQAEPDPLAIELAVMDRMHQGWREKVQSPAFGSWLAAQGDEVRQAYHDAQTATELAGVVGRFDQWSTARQEQADKAAKGQQRLQRAVTPNGAAPRPQAAMTEEEAFRAALRS